MCRYHCGGLAECPGGSTTAFPSALNVAATWSALAAAQWGTAMGLEFRAKGANVQLGPGLCLARVPTGGRNFEYISGEDPVLGAKMAHASVTAIQAEGVIATVKHYVLNNQEDHRNTVSVTVDERTFMELYFPPFQGAVDAKVGAVMCSCEHLRISIGSPAAPNCTPQPFRHIGCFCVVAWSRPQPPMAGDLCSP